MTIKTKTVTAHKVQGRRNLGRKDNHTYAPSYASAQETEQRQIDRDRNGIRCNTTVVHLHNGHIDCDGHDHWLIKQKGEVRWQL